MSRHDIISGLCVLAIFALLPLQAIDVDEQKMYFCTSSDEGFFDCLLNLIGGIHHNDFDELGEIMVFNIGMNQQQKELLKTIQKVGVYEIEKTHQDILKPFCTTPWGKCVPGWYAWKAVAIKQAMDMVPVLLWIDAGTTVYKSLHDLFSYIRYAGYFLHNGSEWSLARHCTGLVIDRFNLLSPKYRWMLDERVHGLEAGLMGLTHAVYDALVLPAYEATKDLAHFMDDGTARGGFGYARHDTTVFSVLALKAQLHIFDHFQNKTQDILLPIGGRTFPLHIAPVPEVCNERTHIYCSRRDCADHAQYIRYKE